MKINKTKGVPRARAGQEPLRRCVGCREMKGVDQLARVARGLDGFFLDESGKSPGRGAYICKGGACLSKAVKSKGFDRSFKQKVPPEIYEGLAKVAVYDRK